jgi:membrane-bound serine protease (ClpP class)
MYINPWLFALIIIVVVVFLVFVVIWVVRAHKRKIGTGREELIGMTAVAKSVLNPKGTVFVQGELWDAVVQGGPIAPEEEVIITRVDGLKLTVAKK